METDNHTSLMHEGMSYLIQWLYESIITPLSLVELLFIKLATHYLAIAAATASANAVSYSCC